MSILNHCQLKTLSFLLISNQLSARSTWSLQEFQNRFTAIKEKKQFKLISELSSCFFRTHWRLESFLFLTSNKNCNIFSILSSTVFFPPTIWELCLEGRMGPWLVCSLFNQSNCSCTRDRHLIQKVAPCLPQILLSEVFSIRIYINIFYLCCGRQAPYLEFTLTILPAPGIYLNK